MRSAGGPEMSPRRRSQREPVPPGLMLQYLVVLAGTDPLVWRRIRVPATYSFWDLHVAIQDAMGWRDYHLHEFRAVHPTTGKIMRLGIPDPDFPEERPTKADWTVFPSDFVTGDPPPIQYTYDFGDNWQHALVFEGYEHRDGRRRGPECVAGGGACPPEDCGGPGGYAELRVALADPTHPEHDEYLEWTGGPIDAAEFSTSSVRFDDPEA
jgi:hypothetical protein